MTEPTEPKQRNMKLVNQHRESIRKKFGIPDDKQVEIDRLRAVLSARDAEIREVLEGLVTYAGTSERCWCRIRKGGSPEHSSSCDAARALFVKLQPTKE